VSSKVSDKILLRVYLLMAAVGIFALLIVVRIGILQFVQKDKWVSLAEHGRMYTRKVPASRGDILSADGKVLATSQSFYRVAIDPSLIRKDDFPNFEATLDTLSKKLEEKFGNEEFNAEYFRNKIGNAIDLKQQHLYLISGKVDFQLCKEMKTWPILRRKKNAGGLIDEKIENKRFYPYNELARITLGSMKDDSIAVRGLEFSFNDDLHGVDGSRKVRRLAGNLEIPLEGFGEDEAEDGLDIVTTLNVEMQDVVETAVRNAVIKAEAKFGVGILMEVNTGQIKAIANYPENYNYAAAMLMEPGSTFKTASVMAALEDGVVNLADSIDINNGKWKFYDKWMEDHAEHKGKVSFQQAFEISSNVAISRVIFDRYGDHPERFIAHLERMGLGSKAMISNQLVGEPQPEILKPGTRRLWSGTTLPWMSIGYNVRLTPLQTLTFYNGIANGGKMIEPLFVKEIRRNKQVVREMEAKTLIPSLCSNSTLIQIRRLLEGVVKEGTAKNIYNETFRIAGKTGTAQIVVNGQYQERYRASFVGYFPANNPKYSLLVLIEQPQSGYYGSAVAAPVFSEIAKQIYAMDIGLFAKGAEGFTGTSGLKPAAAIIDKANAIAVYKEFKLTSGNEPESRWVSPKMTGNNLTLSDMKVGSGLVPNAQGMSARDAMCLLESLGMKVTLIGTGRVVSQSIRTGAVLEKGKLITLTLK
jgi:cell division protein FtsI (penicillin-binding protein 3)